MNANIYRLVFDRSRGMNVAVAETARSAGKAGLDKRRSLRRPRALMALGLIAGAASAVAQGLPSGGTVVQGAGSIQTTGQAMVVQQTTPRMVADWSSFSIGSGSTVQFVQPSSSAVALNRVLGGDASVIFGGLSSNGHVYLQNPNGVLFAPGARVDVGSLVATTLNADITQFMAGRLRLSGGSPDRGAVVNEGQISVAPGGHVVLAAPRVTNSGSIEALGGSVALAAGNAVAVDVTGAGLLEVQVPLAAVDARLIHSGRITADGGQVSLQAAASDAARRTVMQVDGVVRARRVENRGGQIVLAGGDSGIVQVGAELDVSAPAGKGGQIEVLGERVAVVGNARLDASGTTGGGEVLVGGNLQGHGPQPNSKAALVGPGVTLDASATVEGDGGRVIVWSDGHTGYAGEIRATGGEKGGDGGFAEVSGKQSLDFQGGADLRAANGRRGVLLLDPDYIEIGSVADVDGNSVFGDDLPGATLLAGDFPGAFSYITASRVATLLATTDVTLQAAYSIYVTAPISVAPGGAASTLTLDAYDVVIEAAMSLGNSSLTVIGGDISFCSCASMLSANQVRLLSSDDGSGSVYQDPDHTIVANRVVAGEPGFSFGSVDLLGTSNQIRALSFDAYDVVFNNANSGYRVDLSGNASNLDVVAHSGVSQSGPIAADYFTLITSDTSPDSGSVVLTDSANQIRTLGFSVGSHIRVHTGGDLLVAPFIDPFSTFVPPEAGGDISLRATGTFTMDGDLRAGIVAGPSLIDVGGAGFVNFYSGRLLTSGGRFIVRSTDHTKDDYGFIQFGTGSDEFNFVVFGGYPGPEPTTGNGLFTNLVGQLQINPADLGNVSRAYDGTTTITLGRTRTDAGNGVDASVSLPGSSSIPSLPLVRYSVNIPGDFDTPNAGTDKAFTLPPSRDSSAIGDNSDGTRLSYYGLSTPNYRRNAGPSTITPISVVHASAVDLSGLMALDKVYDGTTVATLTGVPVINAAPGDDVALAGELTASFLDKNVGIGKPVTLAGFSLVGADAGNYTITPPTGLSASIAAAPLFLTGLTAANKVYDTTVSATFSGTAAVSALGTDSLTLSGTPAGVFLDKHVGVAKPIQVTGLVLGGADAGNYVLASSNSLVADITPAPLLVSGLAVADKVYDATTLASLSGSASVAPLGGDQVSVVSLGVANFNDKNVGQAKPVTLSAFALTGADAGNYMLVAPTGLLASITPADLAITGGVVATKVYDATTLATLSAAPVVNGLSADEVRLSATLSANFADKNVGNAKLVTLTGAALEGADAGNYRLLPPGTLTGDITPAMLALAGVSVADKVYDASTSVPLVGTPSVTPLGSDIVSVTGTGVASVADKNVGSAKPVTVTGFALAGADAPNYSLVFPTGLTANTTPRPIAPAGIVAIDRITEGPASGNVDVDLDLSNAGVVGVLPGDTVALVTNAAKGVVDSPDPGANKPVTVLGLALSGPDAFNYALSAVRDVNSPVVTLIPSLNLVFEGIRFREYLQAVSDAQEPFRRAMAEALAAGFGKENIRKRLSLGLVFETGLAAPAIEDIQPAMGPASCTLAGVGSSLACP